MERLVRQAEKLQIHLNDRQIEQFKIYYEMLVEKNKVMNLTAITELDEVITKHFVDSIALASVYQEIKNPNDKILLLDLGTGAGFPGIPLKIAFPHIKITLMDSLNKRVKFLQSVIEELSLCDIDAVHGRAEEAARDKKYRECFDICVSRAVANLSTLSEYCIPFVRKGGKFISYKASDIDEEIKKSGRAIETLGGRLIIVNNIILPESDIERNFVFVEKVKATPKIYPRKAGTAAKNPLN
ncbi:MAG: 16S rRNA (guanine(527)-N(7))-methyltransferase RsmG [Lachnospiraceae bacterium]|nr:16S rRNA (guanine(527)-N(7))-methyltransferase RsmG [Lachnospiraceae bacterium]